MPPALPGAGEKGGEGEGKAKGAMSSYACGLHKVVGKAGGV